MAEDQGLISTLQTWSSLYPSFKLYVQEAGLQAPLCPPGRKLDRPSRAGPIEHFLVAFGEEKRTLLCAFAVKIDR